MTTNRRWSCPNGCTPARLAPERARTDDTRTYCLACSEKTGRLVRRVCEAAEKKRTARKQTKAERAKEERAEENARNAERDLRYATSVKSGEVFTTKVRVAVKGGGYEDGYPPHYAQAAQTFVSAILYYPGLPDYAREAIVIGLRNAAPSWFPERVIAVMDSWPRTHAVAIAPFNWTYIAREINKRGASFAEQVRTRMLEQLRITNNDLTTSFADEIESTPA